MLRRIDEGTVVPILGQDLLTLEDEGGTTPLYPYVAGRVAAELGVPEGDLPKGGEIVEVARRYVAKSPDSGSQAIYRAVRKVFQDMDPIPVPPPLARLAEIEKLKLYVTTTFDSLMERAVDEARFGGQRQTLAFVYAPNDKQDLPPEFERLSRPAVFYLMGRLSATPRSYAVTREDVLEFTESLQSRAEDSPGFLSDKLRRSDLLFLGTHFADWLAHLFARSPQTARLVDAAAHGSDAPVLFVEQSSGAIRAPSGRSASELVGELHERWATLEASDDSPLPEPLSHLSRLGPVAPGAVILSCARPDRKEAETIQDVLDRAGVDVILDNDDVELAEKWEMKLRHYVSECSLFLPVISARASTTARRWRRPDWIATVVKTKSTRPKEPFILPVVLDDTTPEASSLPEAYREVAVRWERMREGRLSDDFVKTVVRIQRSYRRASYA